MDSLQKDVTKMQNEIEQKKSSYNYNDAKISSISVPIEAEQEENGKAHETLTEILAEKNKSKYGNTTVVFRTETELHWKKRILLRHIKLCTKKKSQLAIKNCCKKNVT